MEIGKNTLYRVYSAFFLNFWWLLLVGQRSRWQPFSSGRLTTAARDRAPTLLGLWHSLARSSAVAGGATWPPSRTPPGVSACPCVRPQTSWHGVRFFGLVLFALKFCVVANKILVSHMPSSRIRRSVICCATLFLATSPRARTCAVWKI